jgi:FKBP-type peptidyl-prolyl cis-trans isomerase FklB
MRTVWLVVLSIVLLTGQVYAEEQTSLKSQRDKVSYIIGLDIGTNMKARSVDVDPDILARGLKDGLAGNKPAMEADDIHETMKVFKEEMAKKQEEETKKLAEKDKKEGEEFLAENKTKEGVKTLPSGLQYKVITEGTGKTPKATDTVTVNYRGTLIDGQEFDSSYKRGQPATFPVNGVIKGWTEALQLMKEGSKWQLFIPPDLAYGEKGAGNVIGPNATLIFDVELISVKEGAQGKPESKSPHGG